MTSPYCPQRGDVVWLSFDPQSGHGQSGHRPALVLSPREYNCKVGLAILCPITSQEKKYPFGVLIPANLAVKGVILSDQIKNLDWKARRAAFSCKLPSSVVADVTAKLLTLIE